MSEHHGNRIYLIVWVWLLVMTAVEIFLAYEKLEIMLMLTLLLGLSLVKAALIIAYFMHLRFEKRSMTLTLMPPLVICIILMIAFSFPDGIRLLHMRQ